MRGELRPFGGAPRGPQMMFVTALQILQVAMLLVLLAVCGNTANLVLARASTRLREVGVRLSLGAGPGRMVRLMLVENVMLGVDGRRRSGSLIAMWGTNALRAMPAYGAFPVRFQTSVDGIGLLFAIGLGIALWLAVRRCAGAAARAHRSAAGAARRLEGRRPQPDARCIDGVAVALAVLVLVAAALFFQSFVETRGTDPGFRIEGVLLAAYDLPAGARPMIRAAIRDAPARPGCVASPAVESAALANRCRSTSTAAAARFTVEGRAKTTQHRRWRS